MKIKHLGSLLAVSLLAATLAHANATYGPGRRIRFARGTNSATITGTMKQNEPTSFYNLVVRAGQRMSISVAPREAHEGIVPLVQVAAPGGAPSPDKSPRWSTRHTRAGRYVIRVYPNLMASNGTSGHFRLRIWVR